MVTWLYTIIDGQSVRMRYDIAKRMTHWQTVEPYTEPPLIVQMQTREQRRADRRVYDEARQTKRSNGARE